jgi:predicted XRE-type DNA-binding protein
MEPVFHIGPGNVYSDLGYENPEEMLEKAHLVSAIRATGQPIETIARALGTSQGQAEEILHGRFRTYKISDLRKAHAELQ